MNHTVIDINGKTVKVYTFNTIVVGTGAAGYNAADRLWQYGEKNIAVVTEGKNRGTSRNTGSDKQTYYKLTLSGGEPDSVAEMAQTLFSGGCVDGEIALCEAALSAQSFLRLADLGVPFPRNRYGEYVGYKTDHDPRRRATSVGPYTSRLMTEKLEQAVQQKDIPVFDSLQVIEILSNGTKACGVLCTNNHVTEGSAVQYVAFYCKNIIWCTGGPAGMYANSVYPLGHYGATGIALKAGAAGRNLTEWQYGLASVQPRWNVSGTYMQVLPRFVSTAPDLTDEREFLYDFFTDTGDMLTKVFLKGYQWPFDVRKVKDGSSIIDILVYLEQCKNRRVFLDFRTNPAGEEIDFTALSPEAEAYLRQAGACFGTPLERLYQMNAPAIAFYRDKGVDLSTEMLEIALCAQHNNGGIAVNEWWQTTLDGLFCAGEAAASHGVYRPGGSALNAGQVGSARAAQYIAARRGGTPTDYTLFYALLQQAVQQAQTLFESAFGKNGTPVTQLWQHATQQMSRCGAALRNPAQMQATLAEVTALRQALAETVSIQKVGEARVLFRLRDMLLCQQVYLQAMLDYLQHGGKSRGSALYTDENGEKPYEQLPSAFTFCLDDAACTQLQEVVLTDDTCSFTWREAHPIPKDDDFFENVWRAFREDGNVH